MSLNNQANRKIRAGAIGLLIFTVLCAILYQLGSKTFSLESTTDNVSINVTPAFPLAAHAKMSFGDGAFVTMEISPDGTTLAIVRLTGITFYDAQTFTIKNSIPINPDFNYWTAIAFSPDGSLFASGTFTNKIVVMAVQDGQIVRQIDGLEETPLEISFSPDGKSIAALSSSEQITEWDITTGEPIQQYQVVDWLGLSNIHFTPDGTQLIASSLSVDIHIRNRKTAEIVATISKYPGSLTDTAFSPDGLLMASSTTEGTILLWDTSTWEISQSLSGHETGATQVRFSPDGTQLASSDQQGHVIIWQMGSDQPEHIIASNPFPITSLVFASENTIIAGSHDGTVVFLDAQTGTLKNTPPNQTAFACKLAYSPDGQFLAASIYGKRLKIWDATTGELTLNAPTQTNCAKHLAFSANGNSLITLTKDGQALFYDPIDGALQQTTALVYEDNAQQVVLAPGGATYALALGNTIALTSDGIENDSAPENTRILTKNIASNEIQWTLSGHKTVMEGEFSIYEVAPEFVSTLMLRGINQIAYSMNSDWLASSSVMDKIIIWSLQTGQQVRAFPLVSGYVTSLALTSDGSLLATASPENFVVLWDVNTGESRHILNGHTDTITLMAFSPNGRSLITADKCGQLIQWDTTTGAQLRIFSNNKQCLFDLVFSPDGSSFATASANGIITIWEPVIK